MKYIGVVGLFLCVFISFVLVCTKPDVPQPSTPVVSADAPPAPCVDTAAVFSEGSSSLRPTVCPPGTRAEVVPIAGRPAFAVLICRCEDARAAALREGQP